VKPNAGSPSDVETAEVAAAVAVERWVIEREASADRYAVARSRVELETFVRLMHSAGVAIRVHDVH
jgi:hypothetical protein